MAYTPIPEGAGGGGDQVVVGTTDVVGTAIFSNSNNVSFGVGTNGVVTATATVGHTGPVAFQGSGTSVVTNGTVQFANSNGVTFGLNGSTITGSHNGITAAVRGLSAGGASVGAGTVVFSNSNGVSFGLNGSTITASASGGGGGANMSIWQPWPQGNAGINLSQVTRPWFFPLTPLAPMQGNMTWNTFGVAVAGNSTITTVDAHTYSLSFGLYQLNNATQLTLINSVSWTTGLAASASSWQTLYAGTRFITLNSSEWSAAPVVSQNNSYWGAFNVSSSGTLGAQISILGTAGALGSSAFSGAIGVAPSTTRPAEPFRGGYSTTSNALPTSVSYGEVVLNSSVGNGQIPNLLAVQGVSWL